MLIPGTVHSLKAILEVSWQGSLVITLILLVRPLFGLRVPARWRYFLWTLVLLRLLVPALLLPPNPASLQNIPAVNRPLEQASLAFGRFSDDHQPPDGRLRGPHPDQEASSYMPPAPASPGPIHFSWWQLAAGIWLTGALLLGLGILVASFRLRRRLGRETVSVDPALHEIWERCCRSLVIRRPPRLLASPRVDSPALIGVFRPVLLIPTDASLCNGDWEHIFMHELAHCRRFDDCTQALQLLALCVHWFNPLVWFGFRCLRADREMAADEWALQHLSGRLPADYADTLLKILANKSSDATQPAAVGIMEDRAHLKDRMERIVAFGPRKLTGSIVGVAVLLLLAALVLAKPVSHADLSGFTGLTPPQILLIAAHNGDQPVLQQLLDEGVDVNSVSDLPGEHTALASAAAANQMEIVRLLLVKGADLNLKPANGESPVVAAWKQGWTACGDYLLGKGATVDADILAAARGNTASIQKVISAGPSDAVRMKLLADIAAANGHAETYAAIADGIKRLPGQARWEAADGAPVVAIARGHRDVVEAMIQRGSGLNKVGWVRLAAAAAQTAGMREWLISKGYKVAEYSDGERLIDAIEREDLAEIRRLIKSGVDANYRGLGEDDWTPLTRAAEGGRARSVKLLLELGANPNTVRSPGWDFSPLCLAKTTEIADLLLAAGANINAKLFNRDVHIIDHCVMYGPKEMVQWFIDHGVDPATVKCGEPSLLFETGKPEVAEILLDHGVDLNARDEANAPAIYRIEQLMRNPAKIVEVLLKHGADPNMRVRNGYTPLMAAPDGDTVDVLVAAGADINARDDSGVSVVAQYVPNCDRSRLAALIRHGLKPTPAEYTALLVNAIHRHSLDEVQSLLEAGANPNLPDTETASGFRFSPLSIALGSGEFQIAEVLRRAGAKDVGMLAEATAKGDLAHMKSLLDGGADVNESGISGTPIVLAIRQGQVKAVQLLLDRGANVSIFDTGGLTPYGLAKLMDWNIKAEREWSPIEKMTGQEARAAIDAILALLREHKPDVNYIDKDGETALFPAARTGNDTTLALFIQDGANINQQRSDGMTPLMMAIIHQPKNASRTGPGSASIKDPKTKVETHYSRHGEFVRDLLEGHPDLKLRNQAGKTALDLARENGNEEILSLLEQAEKSAAKP